MFKPKLYLSSNLRTNKPNNDLKTDIKNKAISLLDWFGIDLKSGDNNKFLNQKGEWQEAIPTTFTKDVDVDLDTYYLQFGDAGSGYGMAFGDFTPLGGNPNSFSMTWDSLLMQSISTMNIISADSIDVQPNLHLNIFLKTGQSVHIQDNALADSFEFREDGIAILSKYATLNFADDTAAAAGGVPLGGVYHNAGALRVRIV
jgi:hypothetical protein